MTSPVVLLIQGQQQVPCLFFFGDSASDNGNNNFLFSLAKPSFLPYGIDYPGRPTGRFSNGRMVPDFLAELLGFNKYIPPFATTKWPEILQGVNYASSAGGILDDTGRNLGDRLSMNRQLFNHGSTVFKINSLQRNTTLSRIHLNSCLYVSNIGSNDYLNNYARPQEYLTSSLFTPDAFAATLTKEYSRQLRTLYNYGARKIVIFGIGQLGCVPQMANGSSCIDSLNNAVNLLNNRMKSLVDTLNTDLSDAQFIFINYANILQEVPSKLGIRVINAPCCVILPNWGGCIANRDPCSNRSEYLFWDNFHPTEIVNRAVAERAYNAVLPSDAYPTDIRHLVQQ